MQLLPPVSSNIDGSTVDLMGGLSDNAVCSKMGRDILLLGGNAIDAAVTSALCLGVTQQFASGMGGGDVAVYVGYSCGIRVE